MQANRNGIACAAAITSALLNPLTGSVSQHTLSADMHTVSSAKKMIALSGSPDDSDRYPQIGTMEPESRPNSAEAAKKSRSRKVNSRTRWHRWREAGSLRRSAVTRLDKRFLPGLGPTLPIFRPFNGDRISQPPSSLLPADHKILTAAQKIRRLEPEASSETARAVGCAWLNLPVSEHKAGFCSGGWVAWV